MTTASNCTGAPAAAATGVPDTGDCDPLEAADEVVCEAGTDGLGDALHGGTVDTVATDFCGMAVGEGSVVTDTPASPPRPIDGGFAVRVVAGWGNADSGVLVAAPRPRAEPVRAGITVADTVASAVVPVPVERVQNGALRCKVQ